MQRRPREYVLDIYKLLLGGFMALSPWLFAFRYEAARLESVASGVLVVAISIAALIAFADWEQWAVLALGLWLMASPWALGFPLAAAMKIHIAVGLLLVYLAGLELWLIHYNHAGPDQRRP
ncbi:MAG TPA: SPW repeat protein [Hyphomicrobiaceae bacterium]|nr:SPW repeat protein [Hyphomicrobiaceae bacterium]